MALSTQHFRNSLSRLSLGSLTLNYLRTFVELQFRDMAQLCSHHTIQQRRRTCLQTILHGLRRTVIARTLTLMPPSLIPA